MAVVALPSFARFPKIDYDPNFRNQVNKSAWTNARKVMALPGGECFSFSAESRPVYTEAQAREWRAFMMSLRGRENHFLLPVTQTPQGYATNPTVSSAVQGNSFATLNSVPSGGLRRGSWLTFTLTSGLKQAVCLTADVAAGSGAAAAFEFALRENASGTVEVINPVAEVALLSDRSGWTDGNGSFQIAFDVEEAFPLT